MKYTASLDGLRSLAVIAVMAFHAKMPLLGGGFLGVDVFFVLSGFLITHILYQQIQKTGGVNIVEFYARRLSRLYPALLVCIGLYLILAPYAWPKYSSHTRDAMISLFYMADYAKAFYRFPVYLSHIWSLSVEMHFYLLWPFVVIALSKVKLETAIKIIFALFIAATIWRLAVFSEAFWNPTYYRFDTRVSGLLAGSFLALVLINKPNIKNSALAGVGGLLAIITAISMNSWGSPNSIAAGVLIAEIGTGLFIYYLLDTRKIQPLAWAPLAYLGQLSYGIYLFHYPIFVYMRKIYDWPITLTIGSLLSVILAALSYHTIEAMVRNKKRAAFQPLADN